MAQFDVTPRRQFPSSTKVKTILSPPSFRKSWLPLATFVRWENVVGCASSRFVLSYRRRGGHEPAALLVRTGAGETLGPTISAIAGTVANVVPAVYQ